MHLSPWNHLALFASLIFNITRRYTVRAISNGSFEGQMPSSHRANPIPELEDSKYGFDTIESANSIPELEECFKEFIGIYPMYQSSSQLDQLRSNEYFHLNEFETKVCLDYCGFGLFSYLQSFCLSESSSFRSSEITASLRDHALYGSAQKGTAEDDIKVMVMEFLNTPESEYSLVFTVSRGSAFQLLADSYPFEKNKKLLAMFDHESQSVAWMSRRAREKGAVFQNAKFKWPSLRVYKTEMMKMLSSKKRRKSDSATGLFVFPVQSRVSGVRYDYKWMALAKHYNWHVLLDAGSLGPKDMESLGLSIYRPDFIITSFYRVFGSDPTGFGCLLIKKTVMDCLQNRCSDTNLGLVRIVPVSPRNLGDSADVEDDVDAVLDGNCQNKEPMVPETSQTSQTQDLSGAYMVAHVKDEIGNEIDMQKSSHTYSASSMFEETDSIGEMMKSPIFSENGSSGSSCWVSLGQSPFVSESSRQPEGLKTDTLLQTSWFSGGDKHNRLSSMTALNISHTSDVYLHSPVASTLPVSENHNTDKKIRKQDLLTNVIQGAVDGEKANCSASSSADLHGLATERYEASAANVNGSVIRRETELEFIMLGRREGNTNESGLNIGPIASFSFSDARHSEQLHHYLDSWEAPSQNIVDDSQDDDNYGDDQGLNRIEPRIVCRHIDHINMIGQNIAALRIRDLLNWLITSLLQLRFPGSDGEDGTLLVRIYGPKVQYERGAAVAFNIRDRGGGFIHPETVQNLAERNGINLGLGFLSSIIFKGNEDVIEMNDSSMFELISACDNGSKDATIVLEVVTASLGFLTNFEDVYRMWAFVAQFLDPSFVEDEDGGLSDIVENSET